jgi:hypothetical protein
VSNTPGLLVTLTESFEASADNQLGISCFDRTQRKQKKKKDF